MVRDELTVENRAGIHTRPAGQIVKTAARFTSDIYFIRDDMKVNGKSIMGIITLGATYRTKLICECSGDDEEELMEAMRNLFMNRFEVSP